MLYNGDLFDVLPTLAAESIDACVTDPPYGISFMNKSWDNFSPAATEKRNVPNKAVESDNPNVKGRKRSPASSPSAVAYDRGLAGQREFQAWTERWAREVYRVLKPGAHLLVCGAPRSFHRMTSGLEDAGFEIRDCFLYWGFGQGFPKSLQVSNNPLFCQCSAIQYSHASKGTAESELREDLCDVPAAVDSGDTVPGGAQHEVSDLLGSTPETPSQKENDAEREVLRMRESVSSSAEPLKSIDATDMFSSLQRNQPSEDSCSALAQRSGSVDNGIRSVLRDEDKRREQPRVEGRSDLLSEARELCADQVRPMSGRVDSDGAERRLHHGAPIGYGDLGGAAVDANGSRASRRSQPTTERPDKSGAVADERKSSNTRGWPTCDRCGKPMVTKGLGTALKPSYEPIVMARKPIIGTIADNVLKYGTGALNVDACRLSARGVDQSSDASSDFAGDAGFKGGERQYAADLGRWPPNVLLDAEAAAMLDEQTGQTVSGQSRADRGTGGIWSEGNGVPCGPQYDDSGGASRFFYTAKPSRAERDEGCYDLPKKTAGQLTDRKDGAAGTNHARAGAGHGGGRNGHPTVKPVDLMVWLVKLVTPPNGIVLDPFLGSGTTGMAARLADLQFIGVEREAEYIEIARRRISETNALFSGEEEVTCL